MNIPDLSSPHELDEHGNLKNALVVEQIDGASFALGENGFTRSDVSQLLHAKSDELKEAILKRMVDLRKQYEPDSVSDSEIISRIIPRSVGTPSQLVTFASNVRNSGIDKFVKAFQNRANNSRPSSVNTPNSADIADNQSDKE